MAAAENTICVVPELAVVPVFRTVTVHVPLGVDDVRASACATHGEPPSPIDMLRSTERDAADAETGTPAIKRAAPAKIAANRDIPTRVLTGRTGFRIGPPRHHTPNP